MTRAETYFADCWHDQLMLEEHGFDRWPDAKELARYIFDVVDAFCDAQGVELKRDYRHRWHVVAKAFDSESGY